MVIATLIIAGLIVYFIIGAIAAGIDMRIHGYEEFYDESWVLVSLWPLLGLFYAVCATGNLAKRPIYRIAFKVKTIGTAKKQEPVPVARTVKK